MEVARWVGGGLVLHVGGGHTSLGDFLHLESIEPNTPLAVAAWGCEGGKYEKETEGTGVLEAEDVKCKAGQYDFRLDKDFKVFVITKD